MPDFDRYGERLWRWLEQRGFTRSGIPEDPFALYRADEEQDYISYFFVDRPYLHDVVGDPKHPQTAFLMAKRGDGKTATREMTAYECKHGRLRGRAIAVRYYDFGQILEQVGGDLGKVTVRHHVNMLVRLTLKALVDDVPPTYFDWLTTADRQLLMGYISEFADPVTQLRLGQILNIVALKLNWAALSASETLQNLGGIITKLGQTEKNCFQSIYVLIDRVDETSVGIDGAVALLKPLISEGPLLEARPFVFKFFLPIDVWEKLERTVSLRHDRLCIEKISWNRDALEGMVKQRLVYYSNDQISDLGDLCGPSAKNKILTQFIEKSDGSPRNLLRLCHELIRYHITYSKNPALLIDSTEVRNTITEFEHQLDVEKASMRKVAQPDIVFPSSLPTQGLYMDGSGHVFINGQPLAKPLSPREFALFEALYQQAGNIVSQVDLIDVVWPSSNRGDDEQSLRKLVDRLRDRLNINSQDKDYYIKNAKGRGYWLNRGN